MNLFQVLNIRRCQHCGKSNPYRLHEPVGPGLRIRLCDCCDAACIFEDGVSDRPLTWTDTVDRLIDSAATKLYEEMTQPFGVIRLALFCAGVGLVAGSICYILGVK